ncbi:hypothetical protein [Bacillus wiedmannii]|uniref:hypothetical protein n=1 Tax=Bacillus wiedmannii TaxID=1890302 RepID=UPI000BF8D12D|nr:hypothetical protein [Bacillus wiedmannii]PFY98329.1 hypothetical protein COL57_10600 [Bacillus wiedmannii]
MRNTQQMLAITEVGDKWINEKGVIIEHKSEGIKWELTDSFVEIGVEVWNMIWLKIPKNPEINIPQGKEKKEQMSLMFTPFHKEKARRIAKSHNISVSELFAYWLEQH